MKKVREGDYSAKTSRRDAKAQRRGDSEEESQRIARMETFWVSGAFALQLNQMDFCPSFFVFLSLFHRI